MRATTTMTSFLATFALNPATVLSGAEVAKSTGL